jgi:uncharacterized membrane-anchored protein YitT (DUF2179 family)
MRQRPKISENPTLKKARGYFLIILGILSATFGLNGFLLPNGFIDGGVIGISLLIKYKTNAPLSLLILLINLPFLFLGYTQIRKMFAIKTFAAIGLLSLCIIIFDFPIITHDKLLIAVFGGFFLGMGIGLAIRGGCVIDGTEILALYLSRKSGLTIGDIILIINIIIFSATAILINFEVALYSILTYLSASKTVDFVIQGIEEYTGVTIISEKSEEIKEAIIFTLGSGVTVYSGKGGVGKTGVQNEASDIVFTVITRLEISKLKSEVDRIDKKAFIYMYSINNLKGGMMRRRAIH